MLTLLSTSHSLIREVPNNQEVYLDKEGFTSIIFDITERVKAPGEGLERDGLALTTHLEDLVGEAAESVKVWNTSETEFSHVSYVPSPTIVYLRKHTWVPLNMLD